MGIEDIKDYDPFEGMKKPFPQFHMGHVTMIFGIVLLLLGHILGSVTYVGTAYITYCAIDISIRQHFLGQTRIMLEVEKIKAQADSEKTKVLLKMDSYKT
jgi:hypothetical protein